MTSKPLPRPIRQTINRLAHQLALAQEARLHQRLTEQAREALGIGTPLNDVLALLNDLTAEPRAST
jgi:hypothetical protein